MYKEGLYRYHKLGSPPFFQQDSVFGPNFGSLTAVLKPRQEASTFLSGDEVLVLLV